MLIAMARVCLYLPSSCLTHCVIHSLKGLGNILLLMWNCQPHRPSWNCRLGKDFPQKTNSGQFRCAICQVDEPPTDGSEVQSAKCANSGSFYSPTSKPWEGPFLCTSCRTKMDAMEGKRPSQPK
uniref:Uncharacterized protein n=1 Tax=Nelumbo nucifera TaxID=4432 RepID=A0A822Z073_NELNU|nr:TPA_asm: hypothetical protein HUJ06_008808 [Nelumbo nucifera]